tara:strand:- start:262 stop:687 length:426 start_codon:yes stop_codon:yes gene_type:complete
MNRYYKKGDRIKFKVGYTPNFINSKYNYNVKESSRGMILEINHDIFKILLESGKTIRISQEKVDNYITFDLKSINKAILTEYSPKKKIKKSNQKNSFKNAGNSLSNLAKQLERGKGNSKLIEKEIENLLSLKAIIKEQENE